MKGIKTTITCLLLIIFSALLCCTILGWEDLTSKEKKEYTKADMLAQFEQGFEEGTENERSNYESNINELIEKHKLEIQNLEYQRDNLEADVFVLQSNYSNLIAEKVRLENNNKSLIIEKSQLNNQITELNNQINTLNNQITELNNQITQLEQDNEQLQDSLDKAQIEMLIYDETGYLVESKIVRKGPYRLPSYLPNSTNNNIDSWIVEYRYADLFTGEILSERRIASSGSELTLRMDSIIFKAIPQGYSTFNVEIVNINFANLTENHTVCQNSKLEYLISKSKPYSIQEEINGEWTEARTLTSEEIERYIITTNIKLVYLGNTIVFENPTEIHYNKPW